MEHGLLPPILKGELPLDPSGSDPEALFARGIRRKAYGPEARIHSSSTVKVSRTTKGIFLKAAAQRGGSGTVTRMRIKAVHGDYLVCRTVTGSETDEGGLTEGSTDINVAKPYKLRHATPDNTPGLTDATVYLSETIEGIQVDYTWGVRTPADPTLNLDGQRRATANPDDDPSSVQIDIVLPVYLVDDEILTATPEGGTGVTTDDGVTTIKLEDVNADGRAWCQVG